MDGSSYFQNPKQGGKPMSPQTPGGSNYAVNMNRTKTRKWVEAKPQNYDGDDWGADEYDDDEDEDDEPATAPVQSRPSAGQRLPSLSQSTHRQPQSPASGGPPPLRVHTLSHESPAVQPHTQHEPSPSQPESKTVVESGIPERTVSPSTGASRGQDIVQPTESARNNAAEPCYTGLPPVEPSSQSDEHKAEFGGSAGDAGFANHAESTSSQPSKGLAGDAQGDAPADNDEYRRSMSTSPQLPSVARMSTFGMDMFSGGNEPRPAAEADDGSAIQPAPSRSVTRKRVPSALEPPKPRVTSQYLEELASPKAEVPTLSPTDSDQVDKSPEKSHLANQELDSPSISSISDRGEGASKVTGSHHEPDLRPRAESASVPPLRTPSPRHARLSFTTSAEDNKAEETTLAARKESEASDSTSDDVEPTAPLQARKSGQAVPDLEPRPLQREPTASTTTSSPVKESDKLRDEIIRSLSPPRPAPGAEAEPHQAVSKDNNQHTAARESSYTLSAYDSYWADSEDQPPPLPSIEAHPQVFVTGEETATAGQAADAQEPTHAAQSSSPVAVESDSVPPAAASEGQGQSPELRRKFSWELDSDEKPQASQTPVPQPAEEPAVPVGAIAASPEPSALSPISDVTEPPSQPTSQLFDNAAVPQTVVSPPASQVSNASTTKPPQEPLSASEPAPPVSPESPANTRISQDVGRSLSKSAANVSSPIESNPSQGTEQAASIPVAETSGSASHPQVEPFRDIMGMQKPQDRIAKYNETRDIFASMDSGLENWLSTMKVQHPEHAHANPSFQSTVNQPSAKIGAPTAARVGAQPPAEQPYYQQYLNASSTTGASASARSRLAGLQAPAHAATSAFGDSSKQIGTKGKEFMHSAGKVGKGWLSKGKSKLRGSGDKQGESFPPPVQPQQHQQQPPQSKPKNERRASWGLSLGPRTRTEGPALPHASNGGGAHNGRDTTQAPPHQHVSKSSTFSFGAGRAAHAGENGHGGQWVPPSGSNTWRPPPEQARQDQSTGPPDMIRDSNETRVANTQPSMMSGGGGPSVMPEDSGVGWSSQQADEPPEPKRYSSFKGLPPIRRSSTFGLDSKSKKSQEQLIDEEPEPPLPNVEFVQYADADEEPSHTERPVSPPDVPAKDDIAIAGQPAETTQNATAQVPAHEEAALKSRTAETPTWHNQTQSQAEPEAPRSDQPPKPQQILINPSHRLQTGSWKLEESHLSEPLHQVARKRSGTDISQQPQVMYGFDKETGVTYPQPPSPPSLPQPPRQRSSETPPSSAQRYPDLFHQPGGNPPHPEQGYNGQPPYGAQQDDIMFPRPQRNEYALPGVGPPTEDREDRGHRRKASGLLKDLGNKFTKVPSRDRPDSANGARRASVDPRDEASDVSTAAEESQDKKKRGSFMHAARGRFSMDHLRSSSRDGLPDQQPSPSDDAHPPGQHQKKRSVLGATFNNMSSGHLKMPGSASRPSLSLGREGQGDASANDNSDQMMSPPKKRFTDLTNKMSGVADKLGRSYNKDQKEEAREYRGSRPPTHDHQAGAVPARDRPDTTGSGAPSSFDIPAPPTPTTEKEGRRSRRGSSSVMLNSFMGHLQGSKSRDQPMPSQQQQQQSAESSARDSNGPISPSEPSSSSTFTQRPSDDHDLSARRLSQPLGQIGRSPLGQEFALSPGSSPPVTKSPQSPHREDGIPPIAFTQQSKPSESFQTDIPKTSTASVQPSTEDERPRDQSDIHPAMRAPRHSSTQPAMAAADHEAALENSRKDSQGFRPSADAGQSGPHSNAMPPPGWRRAEDGRMGSQSSTHAPQQPGYGARPYQPQPQQSFHGPPSGASGHGHGPSPQAQQFPPGGPHAGAATSPAPQQQQQSESTSSRWKGIRNRVSDQFTQVTAPNKQSGPQAKKDERSGSGDGSSGGVAGATGKLRGAFKRASKMAEPKAAQNQGFAQAPPHNGQQQMQQGYNRRAPPGHVMQQQQQQQPGQQQPLQHAPHPGQHGHPPPPQGYPRPQWRPTQTQGPQGQSATPWMSYQYQRQPMQGDGQQGPGAQYPPGHYLPYQQQGSHGQQGPHQQWSPPPQQGLSSPQSHMHPQAQYTGHHGHGHPLQHPAQHMQPQSPPVQQQQQQQSPPPSVMRQTSYAAEQQPSQAISQASESSHQSEASEGQAAYPSPNSQSSQMQQFSPVYDNASKQNRDLRNVHGDAGSRQTTNTKEEGLAQRRQAKLSVDVDKSQDTPSDDGLYSATPRKETDETAQDGILHPSEVSRSTTGESSAAARGKHGGQASSEKDLPRAELEDTEGARKRAIRLAGQEEKIHYDPAEDPNRPPSMSATSYPGQEWNPFGMPEYAQAWHDDEK